MKKLFYIITLLFFSSSLSFAQTSEEKIISKVLADFENAIIKHDTGTASNLLHDEVVILEGAGAETKDQYLSHHFHSDAQFLGAMNRVPVSENISVEGNMAWVSSISKMSGTYRDKEMNLTSLELAVLKKENDQWKIIALHWSSR